MPRPRLPYSVIRRADTPFIYFRLPSWKSYRSTGTTSMEDAERIAHEAYLQSLIVSSGPTLREYAEPYFVWETCPHVQRLVSEGKSITRNHVRNMRSLLRHHIIPDPIVQIRLADLKRAHILDFRSRLIAKMGFTRTVQRTMSALKIVLKEAFFREEIERDPTAGVGSTKYEPSEIGAFTEAELRRLFPQCPPGPWRDMNDYTVFLTAATTGMRRSEILALTWSRLDLMNGLIKVEQAWKDTDELGLPKWEKIRATPMPDCLAASFMLLFGLRAPVRGNDLVFSYPNGRRFGGTWWSKRFRAAMTKAGIDYEARSIKPHSFRHTLNSLLRDRSYDGAKIRASLGWSDEAVQNRYTHWQPQSFDGQRQIVQQVLW